MQIFKVDMIYHSKSLFDGLFHICDDRRESSEQKDQTVAS